MSAENGNRGSVVDPEEIERADRIASVCRDTPVNCGFGSEYDTPAELIITRGKPTSVTGFRLPGVELQDIERVSQAYSVPYSGDERPMPHIRRHIDEFMLTKPA